MQMNDLYHQTIRVILGFFAIMNPIANTAVFVGLAAQQSQTAEYWESDIYCGCVRCH